MNISVNNKPMTVDDHTTLQGALDLAGISPEGIATALNGTVVPMIDRDATELRDGDSVLVIEPFYGG